MAELFNALTVQEAKELLARHLTANKAVTTVPLLEGLGRLLAVEVRAAENVPGFDRSTMDGFAVRAKDTYGASESLPAYLDIGGEVLMGREPYGEVIAGQVWRIATGGMLPHGADAVVMVEYTEELDSSSVLINRAVAPGENVVRKGEDIAAGAVALPAFHRIRPQDLGMLASVGIAKVDIFQPCHVGIISTGDELVEPLASPAPGQVRDINSYTLSGAVASCGGEPHYYGIVGDNLEVLENVLEQAIADNDIVLISGGSSVGTRDVTLAAIISMGAPGVLFHGISIKPGKPTIGAVIGDKPVFGLPGHPASAMVVFDLLVAPLIRNGKYFFLEKDVLMEYPLQAEIVRNIHSAAGREDFIRVRLFWQEGRFCAEPVLGKSGLINTMVKADGLAYIPAGKEGVVTGEIVRVKLF